MGDLGGTYDPASPSLKDRRLEERAIREGWRVPEHDRRAIVSRVIERTKEAKSLRQLTQALRVLSALDLRQQALDLDREKFEGAPDAGLDLIAVARAMKEEDERIDAERASEAASKVQG